ncbi:PIR Superfamily Protein [Plasmodium ovale wallikeri]|uniref:PIR Superfamily Protein n=1 Tax=Plasmodium ovale wallikeri TaxID=864142 RepID=A0A1A9AGV2_PLAOA|nr:PIR Superfamily Protein [Plasmodium ovale wallikeri]
MDHSPREEYALGFPSMNFYSKYDVLDDPCFIDGDAKQKIILSLSKYNGISSVSDKLVDALCFMSISEGNKENCDYLFYWIGSTLFDNLENENDFLNVIKILYEGIRKVGGGDKCKRDHYNITKENFRKLKIVHDYTKDYDSIKVHISNNKGKCSKQYKTYIDRAVEKYNELYKTCKQEMYDGNNCKLFNNMFIEEDHNKLSTLTCNILEGDSEVISFGTLDRGLIDVVNDYTSNTSSTIMEIMFPLVGILLSCFVLYKFTPAGPWLHSYLIRKKYYKENLYDIEENDLIDITSDEKQKNSGTRLNVAFHQV